MRRPVELAERLAAHTVRTPAGCLVWTGSRDRDGYGFLCIVTGASIDESTGRRARTRKATHIVAFELAHGPVPTGLDVGHVCHDQDTDCPGGPCAHRACLDLDHLAAQTRSENVFGGRKPGLQRARFLLITHCPAGHPYDEANTYRRNDRPHGGRICRECARARRRAAAAAARFRGAA